MWGQSGGWAGRSGCYGSGVRVLIIRLGAFGDLIHTLPLAADLSAHGWTVDWLVEDRWVAVLRGSSALAQIMTFPRKLLRDRSQRWSQKTAEIQRLVQNLRQQRYDVVIDAQGLAKSALCAAFAGAELRIGHARPRSRELSWLVPHIRVPCVAEHVIDQQRALAKPLIGDNPVATSWHFPLPAWVEERRWAEAWLAEQGLARPWILNVGAGWPTKVWPDERQIEWLRAVGASGEKPLVVWGSPHEEIVATRIVRQAGHGIIAPRTTIPQLAALLAQGRIVVSGDTGPLHLALAVGTPALGLFGPVPALRNGPKGNGYRCLQAPGAAWERRDVSKVDMGAISVAAVMTAAEACLSERVV